METVLQSEEGRKDITSLELRIDNSPVALEGFTDLSTFLGTGEVRKIYGHCASGRTFRGMIASYDRNRSRPYMLTFTVDLEAKLFEVGVSTAGG